MQRLCVADLFSVSEPPVAVPVLAEQQVMVPHRHEFSERGILIDGTDLPQ